MERKNSINVTDQPYQKHHNKYIIFLTISDHKSLAKVVRGEGNTLQEALEKAILTYFELKPPKFQAKSVKLDILDQVSQVNNDDQKFHLEEDEITFETGLDGLAFGRDLSTVFLPAEVSGYAIIRRRKIALFNAFKALRQHLPSTYSIFTKPLDTDKLVDLYKIRTKEFFIDQTGYYELYRGHRTFTKLTKDELWEAITLTKDYYFKNVVQKSGKFIYSFLPHRNRRQRKYNILRHAGTLYSMVETYELMPDKELLEEIKRAIKYLLRTVKPLKINGKKVSVIVERDAIKVGGNALAIVALAKYTKVTKDTKYIPVMQNLAQWIKEVQGENGEFIVHKQEYSTGKKFDFISHYYPGEAILSLVRLYQIDGDEKWLDVAENAAHYLIEIRDKNDTIETIAHDHWLLYGLNDLYRYRPKDLYLKHSFFIAEAMMKRQINAENAPRDELIGGYFTKSGKEPGSTPVACRSEGLSAAYKLAKDHGHDEIAERMHHAIQEGIKFQLQMQLRHETVMHYKRKQLCLGAFQARLDGLSLRNDFTQHNISSFIAFYNILNQ